NSQGIRPPLHRRQWRCSSLKYCSMFDSSCLTGVAHRRPRCTWLICGGPLGQTIATAISEKKSVAAAATLVFLMEGLGYPWARAFKRYTASRTGLSAATFALSGEFLRFSTISSRLFASAALPLGEWWSIAWAAV